MSVAVDFESATGVYSASIALAQRNIDVAVSNGHFATNILATSSFVEFGERQGVVLTIQQQITASSDDSLRSDTMVRILGGVAVLIILCIVYCLCRIW
eukprot:400929_1